MSQKIVVINERYSYSAWMTEHFAGANCAGGSVCIEKMGGHLNICLGMGAHWRLV